MIADLDPALLVGVAALLGLAVGSFVNVVIHRLPKMMEAEWRASCAELAGQSELAGQADTPAEAVYNLAVPRSACPACGHAIGALENIPVLSWLWLKGRCRACKAAISPRYPLVELLVGALSMAVVWQFGASWAGLGALLLVWALVALAFIDLDTTYLPDSLTLPLVWAGLLFNVFGTFTLLRDAVIGAMAGYLALWSVFWAFKLATKRDGMGYGDFKLLAALGAWLGWQMLPLILLAASLVGAAVGILMMLLVKHDHRVPIPFGPYLAASGLIALFFGQDILAAWLVGY